MNAAEKPKDNSAFRQPAETINCQLAKGPKTPHEGAEAAPFLLSFLSRCLLSPTTPLGFPPGLRGSAREVRRWRFIPPGCCIVGAFWLQKGQSRNGVQGSHLLVELSCSSELYFMAQEKKKKKKKKRQASSKLLLFISIPCCFK